VARAAKWPVEPLTSAVATDDGDYEVVSRSPVASGCMTEIAYPRSSRSPDQLGIEVRASM
jgi:hypothetical protein